jgi:hypothetical protein
VQCGTELVACLLLMEVSNPSMHLNQLLKELGRASTTLATANQLVFALLFFLCRLCVGPLVVHAAVTSTTTPAVVKAGGIGILVVSLVWFRKVRPGAGLRHKCVCLGPLTLPPWTDCGCGHAQAQEEQVSSQAAVSSWRCAAAGAKDILRIVVSMSTHTVKMIWCPTAAWALCNEP